MRWAEVARFNQLLDRKIKLDEASEFQRKANLQKVFLDSQLKQKENLIKEAHDSKLQEL